MTTQPTQYHLLHSRLFKIVAEFPDNVEGTKAANAFMESPQGQGCGVLAVEDGRVILADCADKGQMARFEWFELQWADGITRRVWAASEARARALGEDLMEREFIEHGDIVRCTPKGDGDWVIEVYGRSQTTYLTAASDEDEGDSLNTTTELDMAWRFETYMEAKHTLRLAALKFPNVSFCLSKPQ